jgi:hypothetical protein
MPRDISEADWKVFRELRSIALERFCVRTLGEVEGLCRISRKSSHERYLDVYRRIEARDKELSRAFDAPRRSRMVEQLAQMYGLGLIEQSELERLSSETRDLVQFLTATPVRPLKPRRR